MAKLKNKVTNNEPLIKETISESAMEDLMGERYATYAKYVIQDRAIPDARDGLKPVQRRIIYSMWKQGNLYSRPTRKCARIVGDVIGKYHPHGDSSIYEALVRMSQDWKNNAPLIDFQGNNGSIDNDPPAAFRYTESRLSAIAEELTRDIDENTIDLALTFDDSEFEPTVLPARFPNLFLNGSEGIAVALATEIPPHNLKELINAIIYRINHEQCEIEDLLRFVKGPDFPTGGAIYQSNGLKDIYLKGRGRIEVIAKTKLIDDGKVKQIIITEIPYKTVKIALVYELDKLRHNKVLSGINEVRDESDRFGMRIVIDLKKEANANVIHKYVLNKTGLKSSYNANMVAIINGRPKTMTLLDYVDAYLAHQVSVITRKSQFELNKASTRLNIVNGLIKAISILNDVVETIRNSKDKMDAKKNLQKKYQFDEPQSEAIVMLQLYKLTNTDISILTNEKENLEANISELKEILADKNKLNQVLINDLKAISKKYGRERKTAIILKDDDEKLTTFDKRDLITKEEVVIALSKDGYIKRSTIKSYRSSGINSLPGLKDGDLLVYKGDCLSTDMLLAFTNLGNYLLIPVFEISEAKWKQEGKHLNYLVNIAPNEKIIQAYAVEEFKEGLFITLLTKLGQIKRVPLSNFLVSRYSRPLTCIKLIGKDELTSAEFSDGDYNFIVFTSDGVLSAFPESDVHLTSLKSCGNKAFSKLFDSHLVALLGYPRSEYKGKIILTTNKACVRIFDVANAKIEKRLGKSQIIFRSFKVDPHELISVKKIENKDESTHLRFLTNALNLIEFDVSDYRLTPLDRYTKKNIDIKLIKKARLQYPFIESKFRITSDIVSKYVKEVKVVESREVIEENKEEEIQSVKEKDENFVQISIFDDDELKDN